MPRFSKTAIVIAGPTAVGKTGVAIAAARHFDTEIISADSRQCYRELDIGVARPSPQELATVPHHFIASHSINEKITAADFESYALSKTEQILQTRDTVIVAGGTGLYLQAFTGGLDPIPEVPEAIRNTIRKDYEANGLPWLQATVARHDPRFAQEGEMQNPHRLLRALEVWQSTGQSVLSFRSNTRKERNFHTIQLALHLPKPILQERIDARVEQMMENGLEEEARALWPYRHLTALQTVGYRELFAYFEGLSNLREAVAAIKVHTRQYAKRQYTWFRKDPTYHWLEPDAETVISHIEASLEEVKNQN